MSSQETDAGQALQAVPATSLVLSGNINDAVNLAQLMAKAKVALPSHLHNNPGECLAIVMMAQTWGMNPYMVGQKTSVISNRLMYEGQLVNAVVNRSGFLQGRLTYDVSGEGEALVVIVSGLLRGEQQPRTIKIGMPKAGEARNSPLWKTQPEQQLIYKAVRMWARRHIPEVLLGVYTPEDDFHEMPKEVQEKRHANAKAIESRVGILASSPLPALDIEVVEEMHRLEAGGNDAFLAGPSHRKAPEQPIEAAVAAQNREAASSTLPERAQGPSAVEVARLAGINANGGQADFKPTAPAVPASSPIPSALTEAEMSRQEYIDAGHPVIEGAVLCPETDYAGMSQVALKKLGSLVASSPAKYGLSADDGAFEMIGGTAFAKALSDKGLGLIADRLRQSFGIKA